MRIARRRSPATVVLAGALAAMLAGCVAPAARLREGTLDAPARDVDRYALRLIGHQALDHRLAFGGTTVGGLSGIDYDPVDDLYYLVSDDRSVFSPTRFYTARLAIDAERFRELSLQKVVFLERPEGGPYPPGAADAESIRFDPATRTLWWSSEGGYETVTGGRTTRDTDPFVRRSSLDGGFLGEVPREPMFRFATGDRGPRVNATFEGLSLSSDASALWTAMEWPLKQDGPPPSMDAGAWSRVSRHDRVASEDPSRGFGASRAQYAYRIDPIPGDGWIALHAQNGISEILVVDAHRLLVLERAFVIGDGWRVRLFEADWSAATDVQDIDALKDDTTFVAMTKRLLLDFDTLPIRIDNLEGLCFGPTLANGHRTLVVVSDDNFNPGEVTQFIAFEIVPR